MVIKVADEIRRQAELLARENKKTEPGIKQILWFPHRSEVRLVETEEGLPKSMSGRVEPFFFQPAPKDGLSAASGVALIRPDEVGKLKLPRGWGTWEDAVEI